MNVKVDFDNIVVKEDKNDTIVKVLMLKGEKGDSGATKTSELTNDSGFITNQVNDLANYYKKTEIYAKTETDELLDNKANNSALNNYYQISEVDSLLNHKADISALSTKANISDVASTYETIAEHNNDISNLSYQISSLASGSPLVANSISEMTDTNKVYVNTTDGHWYYYNDAWVDGGVYQSTQIGDGTITPKKTTFIKLDEDYNLFDGDFIDGAINPTGWKLNRSSFVMSNPGQFVLAIVPVKPNKTITITKETTNQGMYALHSTYTLENGTPFDGDHGYIPGNTNIRLQTSSTDHYLYLYVSSNFEKPFMQVVEGSYYDFTINYYPYYLNGLDWKQKDIVAFRNSIQNSLSGKNIVYMGDSILSLTNIPSLISKLTNSIAYDCTMPGSVMDTNDDEPYTYLGFKYLSQAIVTGNFDLQDEANEILIARGSTAGANLSVLKDIDFDNVDIIVCEYGTNDFTKGVVTLAQYKQTMEDAINRILGEFPHIKFYFISPIYRTAGPVTNAQGLIITDYVEAEKEVCDIVNIPYFDFYHNGNINSTNASYYLLSDGLHPNSTSGKNLIAEKISRFISVH